MEWIHSLSSLLLVLLLNGLLAAAEVALISLRFTHFNPTLKDRLASSKAVAWFMENTDATVRAIRLGMAFTYGAFILITAGLLRDLIGPIAHGAGLFGGYWQWIGALCLAVFLHELIAEWIPRSLALSFPYQAVRNTSLLVRMVTALARPLSWPLHAITSTVLQLVGGNPHKNLDALDLESQIDALPKDAPDVSPVVHRILRNSMSLRELVVSDVILPRNQVQYFDLYRSNQENLEMARKTGHTRFPLCRGDLDQCIGIIHIKDIFRHTGELSRINFQKIKRELIRVDSEEPLESAMSKLLAHNLHMALVVDEFKGAMGVLTLERILEQLVGDIRDEFDADEQDTVLSQRDEGWATVSGLAPLHELEEKIGITVESDEVSTISGLITSELGKIPEQGETLSLEGLDITVLEVDERRVILAEVRRAEPSEDEDENGKESSES